MLENIRKKGDLPEILNNMVMVAEGVDTCPFGQSAGGKI